MNIQEFCIKVQRELNLTASFSEKDFVEDCSKVIMRIGDLSWLGIDETEREAKERCVNKAIKFYGWDAQEKEAESK